MYQGSDPNSFQPYVRLMTTAETLFQEKGFRATGINALLAEAGVARQTLYNHFGSKDGLIEAILRFKSKKVLVWLSGELFRRQKDLGETSLEALFGALGAWYDGKEFQGCIFARAALEYPSNNHPAHKIAATHTGKLFSFLDDFSKDLKTSLPCPAEHLLLLIEGATAVSAKTGAGSASAKRALQAAQKLLKA